MKILKIASYTDEEIAAIGKDPAELTDEELDDLVERKRKAGLGLNGNSNQLVVPFKDVKAWIAKGWKYELDLPPDEAIISLPPMR